MYLFDYAHIDHELLHSGGNKVKQLKSVDRWMVKCI